MNVKIAYIFLMVLDKHVVTMKHYREAVIGLSESAKKLTLDDLEEVTYAHEREHGPYRLNGCS